MRKIILIVLLVLLFVCTSLYIYNKRSMVVLNSNLGQQEESVNKFKDELKIDPSTSAITNLEQMNIANDKELKKLKSVFDSQDQEVPLDVSDKGIYFFESVYATTKLLERKAATQKMIIPPINFAVDVPKDEDIPYLLKQLEMIEDVVSIIIEAGQCDIESITPRLLDKEERMLSFNKQSIQITMGIYPNSLVKVFSDINSHIPLYLIEELSVKSSEENRLRVSFIISRVYTGLSLADIAEFKNKDILDLNVIYPLNLEFESFAKRDPFFKYREAVKETSVVERPAIVGRTGPQFTYKGNIYINDKLVGIIEDNWKKSVCFSGAGDVCSGYEVLNVEEKKIVLFKDGQEIVIMKGASNE